MSLRRAQSAEEQKRQVVDLVRGGAAAEGGGKWVPPGAVPRRADDSIAFRPEPPIPEPVHRCALTRA